MKVLGLIPARGGSKGIPGKNIRPLGGKPLLAWTAEVARASKALARVVLSTEDPAIAEVGRGCGLDVPFLRPSALADDTTPMVPVVRHALTTLEATGERFDAVCLLQPTSPFRHVTHIDGCIALLSQHDLDTAATVLPVPSEHNPCWVYFQDDDGLLRLSTGAAEPIPRRQELPPAFHREGGVYVVRRDLVMEHGTLFGQRFAGYPVDPAASVNLDTPADWARAEQMVALMHPAGPSPTPNGTRTAAVIEHGAQTTTNAAKSYEQE